MTGPAFDMGPPLEDEKDHKHWDPKPCICGLTTYVDAATGLCRECWRAWRWSAPLLLKAPRCDCKWNGLGWALCDEHDREPLRIE